VKYNWFQALLILADCFNRYILYNTVPCYRASGEKYPLIELLVIFLLFLLSCTDHSGGSDDWIHVDVWIIVQ